MNKALSDREPPKTSAGLRVGDFIYLDPSYVPVSSSAPFMAYSAHTFGWAEHQELYRRFEIKPVCARRAINAQRARRGSISELIVVAALDRRDVA